MRVLHFADLHLDASFGGSGMPPQMAAVRREELRGALRRIIDLAFELKADAVTIAGDLYEQERYTRDTGNFLREQFGRISPVPVIIAPGNHDPLVPHSLYRQVDWPGNVFIFTDPLLRPVTVGGLVVWGAAHCSPEYRVNVLSGVRVPPEGIHILLLHASDTAGLPDAKLAVCPLTANEIAESGFELGLLGHYHGARLSPADHPIVCYPGSPEALGFDEVGRHHVLLLELDGDKRKVTLLETLHRPYVTLLVDVSASATRENIRDQVLQLNREKDLGSACVRLHLTGVLQSEVELNMEGLLADLSQHFGFLTIRNETHPGYDVEALKQDLTVKGAFVRKMSALMESGSPEQRQTARDALYLGLQALDRRELRPE